MSKRWLVHTEAVIASKRGLAGLTEAGGSPVVGACRYGDQCYPPHPLQYTCSPTRGRFRFNCSVLHLILENKKISLK